jgi:hypothetical protein
MMLVVDEQKLLTRLRVREANPARIIAIGCAPNAAYCASSESDSSNRWAKSQAGNPTMRKFMLVLLFGVITLAAATRLSHPFPEQTRY